jgi:oligopeptide transport system permease protein
MLRYIISRLIQGVFVLLMLVTLAFFMAKALPGEPFTGEKNISEKVKEEKRKQWGLDKPLAVQYVITLKHMFIDWDFGMSTKRVRPVELIIRQSFPASLVLGLVALGMAVVIGIPLGAVSALRRNTWIDYLGMSFAMIGICVASFVIGSLLQRYVAMNVPFLNIAGWGTPQDVILPALTLALGPAAYLARLTRVGLLEILSQDYIRTAYAKGLSVSRIIIKHALRGGLIPAVSYLGPAFASLISGSFIVETIFSVPGMGQHFVNAVIDRDEFLLLGLVVFYGFLIVVVNLLADIATGLLNPKLRLES